MDAMKIFKAKLGSDHPDTLTCMANLVSTYRNQGRLKQANKLEKYVINARQEKHGSMAPIVGHIHSLVSHNLFYFLHRFLVLMTSQTLFHLWSKN